MPKKKKMFFNVRLPVSIIKEGNYFIAYTPALDLSTSGKSFEEAKKRFNELVSIFFEETFKKGTLDEALQDLGWKKVRRKWSPPTVVANESKEFKIPACA